MNDNIERLRLAAEDTAGGPPSAEQVDALVAYADALESDLGHATKALEAVLAEHHTNDEYEHEDNCPDISDEHRENYHHESIEIGEFYCELIPIRKVCDSCRDDGGYRVEYPCPTVKAITAALEVPSA